MDTLSVVIPAYNEEDGIAAIVELLLAARPVLVAAGAELEPDRGRRRVARQDG